MDIEKLYQDVWARVFAAGWPRTVIEGLSAVAVTKIKTDLAAKAAVEAWDPAKAHAAISAKAKQS